MLSVTRMARRSSILSPLPVVEGPCALLPRRAFCTGAAAALGLVACGGDPSSISVGGLAPEGDAGTTDPVDAAHSGSPGDLASHSSGDLSTKTSNPDLAQSQGNSCATGISGGPASAVTASSPKYVSTAQAYVCRDGNGLYAMSSACTHAGCRVTHETSSWYCNCHGATFDLNGQNPTSPANGPLEHYAMCVDGSGNVQIDTSTIVSASKRV